MSISIPWRVPFHDVDCLGVVWHGHYYKYFELARTELYRSRNLDIADMQRLGYVFPVIETHCRYNEPLRYGQDIYISATFREWSNYLLIGYTIRDADSQRRLAYGHTKQAVCNLKGELLLQVPATVTDAIIR